MKKRIAILGSTGSIGTQTLSVIKSNTDKFEIDTITANENVELLIKQAFEFKPNNVIIAKSNKYKYLRDALKDTNINILSGEEAINNIVASDTIDTVLTAMVGYSGLIPTINAIKNKKNIALANKETLVVAGELITRLAQENNVHIYPVDSEHSAIFQCLLGEKQQNIEKIYLTASGGPFRGKTEEQLRNITKAEALKHPNWTMGPKITIDSASLMNKGLEAIEAKWLFNLKPQQIDIIVHPQSIIHSLVQFVDSSMKAQMGLPDMRLPILFALSYPDRYKADFKRFDFDNFPMLTFEKADRKLFRCLDMAFYAMEKNGNMPCILNAANEIAVNYFLNDKINFLQISDIIERTLLKVEYIEFPTLDDYIQTDYNSRIVAKEVVLKK